MARIDFVAKLNHWRNKSQGAPQTIVYAEDFNRYEKLGADVSALLDDGRLSEEALDGSYAPVSGPGSPAAVVANIPDPVAMSIALGGGF